jgi:hypothetical protein
LEKSSTAITAGKFATAETAELRINMPCRRAVWAGWCWFLLAAPAFPKPQGCLGRHSSGNNESIGFRVAFEPAVDPGYFRVKAKPILQSHCSALLGRNRRDCSFQIRRCTKQSLFHEWQASKQHRGGGREISEYFDYFFWDQMSNDFLQE